MQTKKFFFSHETNTSHYKHNKSKNIYSKGRSTNKTIIKPSKSKKGLKFTVLYLDIRLYDGQKFIKTDPIQSNRRCRPNKV